MKIFDWLHRRLNTNPDYCRVPCDHKKDVYGDHSISAGHGVRKMGTEREALLLDPNVTSIHDVLDGILTIGTLGHLCGHSHQDPLGAAVLEMFPSDTSASKEEEEKEEEEEVSVEILLVPSAEHPNYRLAVESFRREMVVEEEVRINGKVENTLGDEEDDLLEPLLEEIQGDKRGRVTLADLLAAEQHHGGKAYPTGEAAPTASAKMAVEKVVNGAAVETTVMAAASSLSCSTKHSLAPLNKKLVPRKTAKEYSPPATKTLHQRIRRMLKKKIHPEIAGDVQTWKENRAATTRASVTRSV